MRAALVAGAALVVGTPSFLMAWMRTPQVTGQYHPISQPVLFDHRHHVLDAAIDCRFCHSGAERSRYAGVPSTSVCMGCHGQIWNDSPLLAPVQKSWYEDRPIEWNRVHRLPDFVYFDHSAHLHAGVGCVECHGRVDQMAQVYQEKPLTMSWCLDCHSAPERHLRPREQVAVMGDPIMGKAGPDPVVPRAGAASATSEATPETRAELARRYGVRHLTHCSTCHR